MLSMDELGAGWSTSTVAGTGVDTDTVVSTGVDERVSTSLDGPMSKSSPSSCSVRSPVTGGVGSGRAVP